MRGALVDLMQTLTQWIFGATRANLSVLLAEDFRFVRNCT